MCFVTLKGLCAATKVSEMTILHVCTALGYKSYNELNYEFRKYAAIQSIIEVQKQNLYAIADVPHHELSDKANVMAEICKEEFEQAARRGTRVRGRIGLRQKAARLLSPRSCRTAIPPFPMPSCGTAS